MEQGLAGRHGFSVEGFDYERKVLDCGTTIVHYTLSQTHADMQKELGIVPLENCNEELPRQ